MQKHSAWLVAGALLIFAAAGCGRTGVIETHRIPGSETPPPPPDADGGDAAGGACPSGWTCMDIAALGLKATGSDGEPVTASCSNGGQTACDDADPAASCEGLSEPICAHLMLGGQEMVSCAQRCSP